MSKKATREAFGEALARLGETHPEIVVLDADLSKSTRSDLFAARFPARFFEMGIQEQNMVSTAAGLALSGKLPFCCSFACFITSRYDQIRISVAYSKARVRIVGSHAGIAVGEDGYSQQGLEDIALMRALPTMAVLQPADDLECEAVVEYLLGHDGPAYLRTTRHKLERVHGAGYRFAFGRAEILRPGQDLTLCASGGTVGPALAAAQALAATRVEARVVNLATIRPLDAELVERCARETGRLVTVEDHQVTGGLGSAVVEALADRYPVPVLRIGLPDCFGESGPPDVLCARYGLDARGIAERTQAFLTAWAGGGPLAGSPGSATSAPISIH